MPSPLPAARLLVVLGAALSLLGCQEKGEAAKTQAAAKKEASGPAPGSGDCKAPEPADERLATGLAHYLAGDWNAALAPLKGWAESPGAAEDPAAGRGFYSLGYAFTATRRPQLSDPWYAKAEPLLAKSAAESPNLEDLYYLASLHRTRQEPAKQLAVVSRTLALIDEGGLCAASDGDDDFRISRLLSFAGRNDERTARLEQAVAKYEKGQGRVAAYHALALQELGEAARQRGDLAAWEQSLARAAALDPSIPNVHRSLGLAMLQRGSLDEAAEYWRVNWRKERNDGNGLVYAVRLLQTNRSYRKRFGEEHLITNLPEFTAEALEQNAVFEGKTMGRLAAEIAAGGLSEEDEEAKRLAHDVAHYRLAQLLTEYVSRERDVAEFALQNGLLPAIHGTGLPKR